MTVPSAPELEEVIALEQQLLRPEVRHDRQALLALLHEEFTEFGASGRVYDRTAIIDALINEGAGDEVSAYDFAAVRLGPDAVLLTYRTDTPALRTSVWQRAPEGAWCLRHHQGTRAAR